MAIACSIRHAVGVKATVVDDLDQHPQRLLCRQNGGSSRNSARVGFDILFAVAVKRLELLRIIKPVGAGGRVLVTARPPRLRHQRYNRFVALLLG